MLLEQVIIQRMSISAVARQAYRYKNPEKDIGNTKEQAHAINTIS
jgi:hypothetical protein